MEKHEKIKPKPKVITTNCSQVCPCTRKQESSLPAGHRCVCAPETKSHHYRLLTGVSVHPKPRVITTSCSQVCPCTLNQESSLPTAHRCVRAPETKSHHYQLLTGVSVHPKPRVITTDCSQVCPCTRNQGSSVPTAHRCVCVTHSTQQFSSSNHHELHVAYRRGRRLKYLR